MENKQLTHHFEEKLRAGLDDNDIHLVYNKRLGFWVVALWDKKCRHAMNAQLHGCEGCHEDSWTTSWQWVFSCIIPKPDGKGRSFTPVEPSDWLVNHLAQLSIRTRDDVPDSVKRASPSKWASFLSDKNEEIAQVEQDRESREFFDEVNRVSDRHEIRDVKVFHGNSKADILGDS